MFKIFRRRRKQTLPFFFFSYTFYNHWLWIFCDRVLIIAVIMQHCGDGCQNSLWIFHQRLFLGNYLLIKKAKNREEKQIMNISSCEYEQTFNCKWPNRVATQTITDVGQKNYLILYFVKFTVYMSWYLIAIWLL